MLEHCLQAAVLLVKQQVVRQVRGGPIGAPLSPPWLILTVSLREYLWLNSLYLPKCLRHRTWSAFRYVDNRFIVCLKIGATALLPEQLRDKHFYGGEVILEDEPKTTLVGMQLFLPSQPWDSLCPVPQIEARFKVEAFPEHYTDGWSFPKQHLWSYRTPRSACSQANLLGAFSSRLHLALRTSFPQRRLVEALARICFVFVSLGYTPDMLLPSFAKFANKAKIERRHAQELTNALKGGQLKRLHDMGGA